jgi:hypothetical protein
MKGWGGVLGIERGMEREGRKGGGGGGERRLKIEIR